MSQQHALQVAGDSARGPAAASGEYLTFALGTQQYGVDILKVQEIRGYDDVTAIPNTPNFLKGVINLRGTIVPVLDLRLKFNLGEAHYDGFTVMIILNLAGRIVGVVVDSVSDVVNLAAEQVRAAPSLGSAIDARYLVGVGIVEKRMILLIDIERLLGSEELAMLDKATG
ncbi:chemotaxis protein CheW [Pseudomarimonas arenosa]|uniref:Chemotaxis protein CheW n=1 Tax=Pseudomarimonas arenosa TaxID=2774145 RepID=A0AAW3ZFP7_9GAMM|nr:chemotaxis protein CheW [Pseudomarimonas arenosa]MBD8524708.1 chemotaxis protein CheW [Pseudomarimonas arenosa]